MAFRRSNRACSISSLPASMRERSRMSLSNCSSECAELSMSVSQPDCSAFSGESISMRVSPMSAFSGVRTSWLMLARNSLLARLACSASSRACWLSCSMRLRSPMSDSVPIRRNGWPLLSCSATMPWVSTQSHPLAVRTRCWTEARCVRPSSNAAICKRNGSRSSGCSRARRSATSQ